MTFLGTRSDNNQGDDDLGGEVGYGVVGGARAWPGRGRGVAGAW